MTPIRIDFDGRPNNGRAPLHLPKIRQGVAYSRWLRVRTNEAPQQYVDFRVYDEMVMSFKRRLSGSPAFTLRLTQGHFVAGADRLTILIPPELSDAAAAPDCIAIGPQTIAFVHDCDFYQNGEVVWRFCEGSAHLQLRVTGDEP